MIGLDFDNTIAVYDRVFLEAAVTQGLVEAHENSTKSAIRDAVRRRPHGEREWQSLQAEVYGPRMSEAHLMEGVIDFLHACSERDLATCIVSHKTQFARRDVTQTDLRAASVRWMESSGLFDRTGLDRERVFFADTRQEKVARIETLGCTHFVDDLVEVFLEEEFPEVTTKVLLAAACGRVPEGVIRVGDWTHVRQVVLGD